MDAHGKPRARALPLLSGLAALLLAGGAAFARARQRSGETRAQATRNDARMLAIVRTSMEAIITDRRTQRIVIFNPMAETAVSLLRRWTRSARRSRASFPSAFAQRTIAMSTVRRDRRVGPADGHAARAVRPARQRRRVPDRSVDLADPTTATASSTRSCCATSPNASKPTKRAAFARGTARTVGESAESARGGEKPHRARVARRSRPATDCAEDGHVFGRGGAGEASPPMPRSPSNCANMRAADRRDGRVACGASRPTCVRSCSTTSACCPPIDWLADDFTNRYGIEVERRIDSGDDRVSRRHAATALFRIVQEALTNVARHAEATRVTLDMHIEGGECHSAHHGQRTGRRATHALRGKSFGLLGMRERAHMLGGIGRTSILPAARASG